MRLTQNYVIRGVLRAAGDDASGLHVRDLQVAKITWAKEWANSIEGIGDSREAKLLVSDTEFSGGESPGGACQSR